MHKTVDVHTGEIKLGSNNEILICRALGSCVAVVIIDPQKNIGGIAHVMLPNAAPLNTSVESTKYAQNAISTLIEMIQQKSDSNKLIACIAGGGNVLHRDEDTICKSNIESVSNYLGINKIPILNKSTGGYERRSVTYINKDKLVQFTKGNSNQETLLQY